MATKRKRKPLRAVTIRRSRCSSRIPSRSQCSRSADPRYGNQPGTASFCNADDDLIPLADLWLHGHLHCRHDYRVERPGAAPTRVVCQAMGLAKKGENAGFDPLKPIALETAPAVAA